MIRYSFSTSFVPRHTAPGDYMFYVTFNRWEDDKCVDSTTIYKTECTKVPEAGDKLPGMDWAAEMADLAWNLIIRERSAERYGPVRGANDKYRDTTEKPFLS